MAQWYETLTATGKLKAEVYNTRQTVSQAVFSNTGTGVCELWRRSPDFTIDTTGNTLTATPNDAETIDTSAVNVTFADANPDTITRASGDWRTKFAAGQVITVSGSTLNDGTYTLVTVAATVLTLTTTTDVLAAEVMSTGNLVVTALYDTLTRASGTWASAGIEAGDVITIDTTTGDKNEGTWTVVSISGTTHLQISENTMVAMTEVLTTVEFTNQGTKIFSFVKTAGEKPFYFPDPLRGDAGNGAGAGDLYAVLPASVTLWAIGRNSTLGD